MMNKFRKVCSASLCAVSLNSLGAGATSAIKIDIKIEDIGEICPNIHRKWADIYFKLLTLEYFKGNAFDWRTYEKEILEDIKKLIIDKGAANIDAWDIVNIVSTYTYKGDKVLVKFRKNNGKFNLFIDNTDKSVDETVKLIGEYIED